MSYPRNAATPPRVAVGPVVQISDGAVQTSGVSIRIVPQGGSAAAGLGTTTYEDGIVLYAPTQAETNYEAFAIIAYKTGCIPASTTVVTSASATAGYGGLDFSKIISTTATVDLSGTTIKTATDIETDTQDIQSRLPAALIGGRIDSSVGAYQSGLTPLQPTVAGRTLDVSAGGEAGIDWANIGSPTTSVAFTNTTISTSQVVASVTGNVGGNVAGSVGSISGVTFPGNFGSLAITVGGAVTAGTVSDKTGYSLASNGLASVSAWTVNITGSLSGSVGSVTGAVGSVTAGVTVTTNNDKTGYTLTQTFPANFASLGINASGHISRVTLVDTTTTNSDMRGTDGAALATHWTSTRAGYLDGVLIAANFNQRTVSVTGSNHIAADIHELQPAVIQSTHFDLGAIDANALAADAASEIATAVWSNATRTLTAFSFSITVDAASIRSAIGMASANLDTQLDAIPTAAEIDTQLTASHGAGSWAVGGTGSGAYTLTVTVDDGTSPLQNATVRMTEGVNAYVGQTNASGIVTFSLDAATYSVAITKDGYSFTPTTKVVGATGSQTYSMTQITPTIPAAAGLSTGTAVCYGTTGLPIAGVVVTVQQVQGKGTDGSAYDGDTFTLTSNASGVISHNGFVRGAVYSIRRGIRGEAKSFTVPDAASFDLSEIVGRD